MSSEIISKKCSDIMRVFPKVKLAILFGSAAMNRLRDNSDIDIAVAGDNKFTNEELFNLYTALTSALQREIDLLDMKNIHGLILSEIVCKGKRIISEDRDLLVSFMSEVIYYNEDFLRLQQHALDIRNRRFAFG